MTKYKAKKAQVDGITFHSTVERDRYLFLKLLEKSGEIKNFELQPQFELQEKFKRNGKSYMAIKYIADFSYYEGDQMVIEDVKGKPTPLYEAKKKIFLRKNIKTVFREIRRKGKTWEVTEL